MFVDVVHEEGAFAQLVESGVKVCTAKSIRVGAEQAVAEAGAVLFGL